MNPRELFGPSQTVLITGASSGIGAALAVELAPLGGRLALVARRRERLDDVAERARAAGAEVFVAENDVSDLTAVRATHERIVETLGAIDVAFLNAGTADSFRLHHFSAVRVRRVVEVNFFGVVNWLEVLLKPMLARKSGRLVAVSSLAGHRGNPFAHGYGPSKAALSVLMESVRLEAKPAGIGVTVVEPGFVQTEMTEKMEFKPFLIDCQKAARIIVREVAASRDMIRFPWQTAALVALQRHLPIPVYDAVIRRLLPGRVDRDVRD